MNSNWIYLPIRSISSNFDYINLIISWMSLLIGVACHPRTCSSSELSICCLHGHNDIVAIRMFYFWSFNFKCLPMKVIDQYLIRKFLFTLSIDPIHGSHQSLIRSIRLGSPPWSSAHGNDREERTMRLGLMSDSLERTSHHLYVCSISHDK